MTHSESHVRYHALRLRTYKCSNDCYKEKTLRSIFFLYQISTVYGAKLHLDLVLKRRLLKTY